MSITEPDFPEHDPITEPGFEPEQTSFDGMPADPERPPAPRPVSVQTWTEPGLGNSSPITLTVIDRYLMIKTNRGQLFIADYQTARRLSDVLYEAMGKIDPEMTS